MQLKLNAIAIKWIAGVLVALSIFTFMAARFDRQVEETDEETDLRADQLDEETVTAAPGTQESNITSETSTGEETDLDTSDITDPLTNGWDGLKGKVDNSRESFQNKFNYSSPFPSEFTSGAKAFSNQLTQGFSQLRTYMKDMNSARDSMGQVASNVPIMNMLLGTFSIITLLIISRSVVIGI